MPFYEHVMLDHYLEEFPEISEIQNFMKLVLNGLSDNPFLTVEEKKNTIEWYKNYFSDKLDIINESIRIEKLEGV
jgi:small subunit ribosomal protein S31